MMEVGDAKQQRVGGVEISQEDDYMSGLSRSGINYAELIQEDRIQGVFYTDPQIFAQELERIFYRGWVFVGHASEIPKPGDFVTRFIGRQPAMMVRDKQGQVRVLLNRCAHRGSMLCTQQRGNAKVFTCPYHGWTYDVNGTLLQASYPGGYGETFEKHAHGLAQAARVDSYRGFVFANLSPQGVSLAEHLGAATRLIDQSCDLSPEGELELTAGWIRHRFPANWKMLVENDTDGYHVGFAHAALMRANSSQYQSFTADENRIKGILRDWGNGHTEIDFTAGYKRPFDWFGGGGEGRYASYMAAMEKRYGKEVANQRLFAGPSHAVIFPNLFLGEMNIAIFQPVSVEESIQWHTPLFLKGAPELNKRLLRQSEGAMGPTSFLIPEDAAIAARNQLGLQARHPQWLDVGRGLHREWRNADGMIESHMTDETTNRGLWRHYKKIMTEA
jgi:phenylpropionate dioxygenase-like ring-hydroxylating dioxygenase large terminal subunit